MTDKQATQSLEDRLAMHQQRVPAMDVLVVDDQTHSRMVLGSILHRMGHRTTGCASGERALTRLRTHRHAMVLSDLHMPGMNGVEFLKAVRQTEPSLPVVIVTADPDATSWVVRDTYAWVMRKPVDIRRLCELIEGLALPST